MSTATIRTNAPGFFATGLWPLIVLAALGVPQRGRAQALLATLPQKGDISCVVLSPDGKAAAVAVSGSRHEEVFLWDIQDIKRPKRRAVLKGHKDFVNTIKWSPDGSRLAITGSDEVVKLWDTRIWREKATIKTDGNRGLAFSPDSKLLALSSWDNFDDKGAVKLYDAGTGKELATLPGLSAVQVYYVAFSPDGKTLATSSWDGQTKVAEVKLWDVRKRQAVITIPGTLSSMRPLFSPDGKVLATDACNIDPIVVELKLWDTATGRQKASLTGHTAPLYCKAFSPDSRVLATGAGILDYQQQKPTGPTVSELKLWEVASGKLRANLVGHSQPVGDVAFSPDGKLLVSGGGDIERKKAEVCLWDIANGGKRLAAFPGHTNCILFAGFLPGGRVLVTAGDKTVKLWDIAALLRGPANKP